MATVVAFHAHPDDEVLLTGGTLARLAAEGDRVIIAVATDGIVGSTAGQDRQARLAELRESAAVLGAARVVHLGYAESGHGPVLYRDPPGRVRFARADVDEAAGKLASLIRAEHADLLLSYDSHGGYGHRDHMQVHRVGARAARLAGGVRVLEATLPWELAARLAVALMPLRLVARFDLGNARTSFTPRSAITCRVDVRPYAAQKRAALAVHKSQLYGKGRAGLLFRMLAVLPLPVFRLLCGREWFTEPGTTTKNGRWP
jgi:LmbE family N-acetylglucosaminyl deacetylase